MNRRIFITVAATGTAAFALRQAHISQQLGSLRYAWCGAVTSRTGRVVVCTKNPTQDVRLIVDTHRDFSDPIRSDAQSTTRQSGNHASFDLAKLNPNTVYHYGVEITNQRDTEWIPIGQFQTFPEGMADLQIAFASCARTGSTAKVFETIAKQRPHLFVHMGDMHYEDIGVADTERRRTAYASVNASPSQATLYHHVPLAYVWDDHDFLGNNSDGVKVPPQRQQAIADARLTYQEAVPHYPLPAGTGDVPIYQAFTIGRVRMILTDLRSEKIPGQTMLGERQKRWFKDEVIQASRRHPLIVWVSSVPWIGKADARADFWAGYANERRELADFFKEHRLQNRICIVSGDAHMLAIDDGTNSDYATGGGMPIPVFQAAALDQRPSKKGGPYSHPVSLDYGQFGLMTVQDGGSELSVTWQGMSEDDLPVRGIRHTFKVPA